MAMLYLCKNIFRQCKKVQPSKVAGSECIRDQRQQDLISECAYAAKAWHTEYINTHYIASYYFQTLIGLICFQP